MRFGMKLKRGFRNNKVILIFFMIVILQLNCFAAAVSDNDGSAFITKAEFDSLKNDFQSTLDSYNTSIDNKIDNAISEYLAGIKAATRIDLKTNLNKDGKLNNGIAIDWSSSSTKYFGDTSGERLAIETYTMYFDCTNKEFWASGGYQWKERTQDVPSVAARKYLTSKEVKSKLDDGTEIKSQTRMKVRCNIIWWWEEWQPISNFNSLTNWTPSSPAKLGGNYGNVKQNTKELYIYGSDVYNSTADGPYWVADGGITVETKDIADDNENYTYDELMCPLSTANEFVWDITVNDQNVTPYGSDNNRGWTSATNLNWLRPHEENWFHLHSWATGGPKLTDGWKVPWMKQNRTVQNMYLTNLISIDNRHRQVKNGFILTDTDKKGDYTFKVSATEVGKFYVYIGSTPISNWTEAGFAGRTFDITEANKVFTFDIKDVTEEKKPIWICYLPTSTTNVGRLKIDSVYYETES